MNLHHLRLDVEDWWDRNPHQVFIATLILAALFTIGAVWVGTPDDGRGDPAPATVDPLPAVVGTAPGSPVSHGGVEPGATNDGNR